MKIVMERLPINEIKESGNIDIVEIKIDKKYNFTFTKGEPDYENKQEKLIDLNIISNDLKEEYNLGIQNKKFKKIGNDFEYLDFLNQAYKAGRDGYELIIEIYE